MFILYLYSLQDIYIYLGQGKTSKIKP